MAFYICGKCEFRFERRGPVEDCPSCGCDRIREMTGEEHDEALPSRRTGDLQVG